VDAVVQESIEQGTGAKNVERLVDAASGLLVGELDDVGGSVIELTIVTSGFVFFCPSSGVNPDATGAPPMVAHDDESSRVPLMLLVEKLVDVAEILVAEREIIDVRGVSVGESLLFAVVKAVGVRNRHMEEEEGNGRVGEVGVACGDELAVVGGVLADVAVLVGGTARPVFEEMFGVEKQVTERP